MLLGLVILFTVVLIVFFAIAFFLPEWLGITGKKAQEVMAHQQGDAQNSVKDSTGARPQVPSPGTTKDPQE